jgi:hypothetical protein
MIAIGGAVARVRSRSSLAMRSGDLPGLGLGHAGGDGAGDRLAGSGGILLVHRQHPLPHGRHE